MNITEELRQWARRHRSLFMVEEELNAIAVRIDAAHKRAIGYVDARDPETMTDNGWIKLPVDADGVIIHVGDKLTDGEYTFTVCELAAYGDGSWSIRNEDGNAWAACDVIHCKPDSWEDIITDALKFAGNGGIPVGARFADYAEEFVERCRRLNDEIQTRSR